MTQFNYEEEVKKLQTKENMNWFKPKAGQYNAVILAEPEKITKTFEKEVNGELVKEEVEQARLTIEIEKEQFLWDIGVGQTANSIFGQLMLIAKDKGKLTSEKITLLVKRSKDKKGKEKNDYTIMEALSLMKTKEEEVK